MDLTVAAVEATETKRNERQGIPQELSPMLVNINIRSISRKTMLLSHIKISYIRKPMPITVTHQTIIENVISIEDVLISWELVV